MSEDALARAREIAARLSGSISVSDLGKRKNRWGDDANAGLGSMKRKKIYFPTDEDPDINYLGLLIGPKGLTQKQMQEQTGAKILIRGQGSAKDGGPSVTGHPDDNDQLHVYIEGSEEAVDRASKEIEEIFNNPAHARRLKAEQLRQLGSGSIGGGDIYGPGGDGGGYQIEMRVPNQMVGLIIGKGGENIVRIQTQLGIHAQIAKESEMKPGETQRSIVIRGNPTNVEEAKRRIEEIIEAQIAKTAPSSSGLAREVDNAFVVKLPVPNDKVGIIIGKGGMTIKGVQERTRCNIQIPPAPDDSNTQIRTLTIGGDTKEAVDAAQMEIFMILQMQLQTATNTYNAAANAMLVAVPDERVGVIIGRGGANVKELQNRHQVRIQIPQTPDIGSNPPVRTISIYGVPEAQQSARYEIEMIASGTPLHALNSNYGSYGSASSWGSGYGAAAPYAAAAAYPGAMAASPYGYPYGAGMDMSAYYGMTNYSTAIAPPPYGSEATAASAAATTATAADAVPTDPTAYYNDFWQYAAYYGEAAARMYYGAWAPPEGTPPPEGVVLPVADADAATAAATTTAPPASAAEAAASSSAESVSNNHVETAASESVESQTAKAVVSSETSDQGADNGIVDPQEAAKAWEAYKQQYAEWYEAYGKAQGADPNPPMM